jgi:CDP-2,3-bis-(O-geranylgeranyl)-sn-glycerol synthase
MHEVLVVQLLVLLGVANGTPVALKSILGDRFAYPIDGGARLADGQPLFGHSKTMRGVLLAVLATTLVSLLLGLGWKVGVLVGVAAMAGDLFSSFTKRRLGLAPSSMALGLDQIPESLFPLLACRLLLPLSFFDVGAGVTLFFIGGLILSRILFRFNLRDRPY